MNVTQYKNGQPEYKIVKQTNRATMIDTLYAVTTFALFAAAYILLAV